MTVGELKNVLDEVPDDAEVFYLSIGLDIPLEEAWVEKNEKTGEAERVLLGNYW